MSQLRLLRKHSGWLILGVALLAPLFLSTYNLSILGRFIALSILGIGISLIWGHAGILSLGQGVFFGLGAYAIAMHLKMVADQGMPDFMLWNGVESLPWWWKPFESGSFALVMVLVAPALLSGLLAWLVFRRRITGVYIALITQALSLAFSTFLVSQQGLTGGFNGLTNFRSFFGHHLAAPEVRITLYYLSLVLIVAVYRGTDWITRTHVGKILRAIRDGEDRVRFFGYDTAAYKSFAFTVSGMLAGIGGALYTLHVGVISPAMVGVVPSIEMVVWVALGGRDSLAGAVLGTLLGNLAKDQISSAIPEMWLYVIGSLFVLVVTVLPKGLIGITRPSSQAGGQSGKSPLKFREKFSGA